MLVSCSWNTTVTPVTKHDKVRPFAQLLSSRTLFLSFSATCRLPGYGIGLWDSVLAQHFGHENTSVPLLLLLHSPPARASRQHTEPPACQRYPVLPFKTCLMKQPQTLVNSTDSATHPLCIWVLPDGGVTGPKRKDSPSLPTPRGIFSPTWPFGLHHLPAGGF